MPTSRPHRRSSAEIDRLLNRQASSGLSVAAFCRQADVNPASFYTWRRKRRSEKEPAFVEVALDQSGSGVQGSRPHLSVRTRDGHEIVVLDVELARDVLCALFDQGARR